MCVAGTHEGLGGDLRSPGIGATDGCKLPCGKQNQGLSDQQVFLIDELTVSKHLSLFFGTGNKLEVLYVRCLCLGTSQS